MNIVGELYKIVEKLDVRAEKLWSESDAQKEDMVNRGFLAGEARGIKAGITQVRKVIGMILMEQEQTE